MVQALIVCTRQDLTAAPQSYRDFGFAKFGLCCWNYNGYDGEIEWINTDHFITQSKLNGPTGLRYYAAPGVQMLIQLQPNPQPTIPDVAINTVLRNAVTGKGMPMTGLP